MITDDRAAQIANDIAEGIDNRETRKELRQAVQYFASLAAEEALKRAEAEGTVKVFRAAKGLMDAFLSDRE